MATSWEPISEEALRIELANGEVLLDAAGQSLWHRIRLQKPAKWCLSPQGDEGGGFWVVAKLGREVLWFNDIEDGFNWSQYTQQGLISEYCCEQSSLDEAVRRKLASVPA